MKTILLAKLAMTISMFLVMGIGASYVCAETEEGKPDVTVNQEPFEGMGSKEKALFQAVDKGEVDEVKKLLAEGGVDINAKRPRDGRTVLHIAVWNQRVEIVKILLEDKEIDLNVKDKYGKTPLARATECGFAEVGDLLKKAGAKE